MEQYIESQRALARELRALREIHEADAHANKRIADALEDLCQQAKRRD